jgi:hypothetical protein
MFLDFEICDGLRRKKKRKSREEAARRMKM